MPLRIGSDLAETELPLPAKWCKIDYAPGSPTYGTVLASGTRSGQGIADWAWIDGGLPGYRVGPGRIHNLHGRIHRLAG